VTERLDPRLVDEIKRLGAFDLEACYSCGNCSAMCPLCDGDVSFPRKMIRYSMLGMEDRILSSTEPWLCYYCGECSDTCPREADPGSLMMALRRYTIRKYSVGRIADVFESAFTSGLAWLFLTAISVIAILLFYDRGMNLEEVEFLSFISLENIHNAGLFITGFIMLSFLANTIIMARAIGRGANGEKMSISGLTKAAVPAAREAVLQERFATCEGNELRRLSHIAISWGFMGMFLATLIIMGIDYEYLPLPRVLPFIIGSVSGAVTLAGAAYFIYLRIAGKTAYGKYSHRSDWSFLVLLVLSVVTGYVMVAFRLLDLPMAAYISFAIHLVVVFNFLVSLPFTKFAHVVYRPLALWLAGVGK
jgi:heterodisulfide reductase subunit C